MDACNNNDDDLCTVNHVLVVSQQRRCFENKAGPDLPQSTIVDPASWSGQKNSALYHLNLSTAPLASFECWTVVELLYFEAIQI